jgi:hypothetical protein
MSNQKERHLVNASCAAIVSFTLKEAVEYYMCHKFSPTTPVHDFSKLSILCYVYQLSKYFQDAAKGAVIQTFALVTNLPDKAFGHHDDDFFTYLEPIQVVKDIVMANLSPPTTWSDTRNATTRKTGIAAAITVAIYPGNIHGLRVLFHALDPLAQPGSLHCLVQFLSVLTIPDEHLENCSTRESLRVTVGGVMHGINDAVKRLCSSGKIPAKAIGNGLYAQKMFLDALQRDEQQQLVDVEENCKSEIQKQVHAGSHWDPSDKVGFDDDYSAIPPASICGDSEDVSVKSWQKWVVVDETVDGLDISVPSSDDNTGWWVLVSTL